MLLVMVLMVDGSLLCIVKLLGGAKVRLGVPWKWLKVVFSIVLFVLLLSHMDLV